MNTEANEALFSGIPPTGYQDWITLSMAYKDAGGDYSTWLEWCKTGSNPIAEADAPGHWQSFKPGQITKATLFDWAYKNGWKPTAKAPQTREAQTPKKEQGAGANPPPNAKAERQAAAIIEKSRQADPQDVGTVYLWSRGISAQTAEFFKTGYLTDTHEIIFPYLGYSAPYYAARNIDITPNAPPEQGQRWRMPGGLAKQPYNMPAAFDGNEGGDIFLVEGQIDVLSLAEIGYRAITAEGCEAKLANAAKEKQGQGVEYRFLIIPDNDADPDKGEKTAAKMLDTLTAAGLTAYIARIPASYHDANDYLTKCRAGLEEWAKNAGDHAEEEAHVTYNRQSAAGQIDQWAAEWETGKDTPTATGLYSLDELLDGGLYPGLYVIGALSSLGKTSFCLQIADYVAQSRDVLYIALEQSAAELTAKTLSRLTAELSQASGNEYKNALTARNITSKAKRGRNGKDQMQTLAEAIKQYREGIGKRIFFLDAMTEEKAIGTDEIKKRLEEHKTHRGEYPLVVVDYIQILAPPDTRATDKQNADKNIVELKRMARGLNIPIIGISSFNRENYNNRLSLAAFKESGAIEYTADVVIGLQPQGMKEVRADRDTADNREIIEACKNSTLRSLEIVVLKNRQGMTGAVNIEHNTMFNRLTDHGKTGRPDISGIMQKF